jgi:hypothetical protein
MSSSKSATIASPNLRRATKGDRDALMAFYAKHHAQRSRLNDPALWNWEFVDQPDLERGFPFFVLEHDGAIVGGIGYVATRLSDGIHEFRAAMPVNFFVDPAFKGLPALRLFRSVQSEYEVLVGSYISDDALRLLTKSGFVDLSAHVRAYHYPLRIQRGHPRSWAVWSLRKTMELWRRYRASGSDADLTYRVETHLAEAALVPQASANHGAVHLLKSAPYLRWRYGASPKLSPVFVAQFQGTQPVGLAVLHFDSEHRECVILDVMFNGGTPRRIVALIDQVIRVARKRGCHMITTHALSATLDAALKDCYFKSKLSHLGLAVLARQEPARSLLTDPDRWHFMLGDTDAY